MEKTMKTLKSILAAMLVVVLFAGILTAQGGDIAKGKEVFLSAKCNTCHTITKAEITSKGKAPDLSEKGGIMTDDNLKLYLNKEFDYNSKKHPVKFKGTADELKDLVTFLQSLIKAEE